MGGLPRVLRDRPVNFNNAIPDPTQTELLRALILRDPTARRDARRRWLELHQTSELDWASQRLVPLFVPLLRAGEEDLSADLASAADPMLSPHLVARRHRDVARANLTCLHHGFVVLDLFEAHGIDVVVTKGASLAVVVYGSDWGSRAFADIDVLVPRRDGVRAAELLAAHGYWTGDDRRFGPTAFAPHCAASYENGKGAHVDLHWRLSEWQQDPEFEARVFDRRITVKIAGRAVHTLDPTDHLLHTFMHGLSANVVAPIRWVVDAALLIRTGPIDWDRFLSDAAATRTRPQAAAGIQWLHRNLDADIPFGIEAQLRKEWSWTEETFGRCGPNAIGTLMSTASRYAARTNGKPRAARWKHAPRFLWDWAHLDGRSPGGIARRRISRARARYRR